MRQVFLVLLLCLGCGDGGKEDEKSIALGPSAVSATLSNASISPTTHVLADGATTAKIAVVVRDANGAPLPGREVAIASTGTGNTIAQPAPSDAFGVTTATLASTVAEQKVVTVTVDPGTSPVVLASRRTIRFVGDPGTISATLSSLSVSPSNGIAADGVTAAEVTVVVRDAHANPVAGQMVEIAASGGGNSIAQPSAPTDEAGAATARLASTSAGTKTLTATVNPGAAAVVLASHPTIAFGDDVIADPHQGGQSSSLRIVEIRWGRLVSVFDAVDIDGDPQTPPVQGSVPRHVEFLIAETVGGDGVDYVLETDPFTEQVELTILADASSGDVVPGSNETGAERFARLLQAATTDLGLVPPIGLGPSFLPPFPVVPRNAALSIRFSDLLDPSTIGEHTVRVLTGNPPLAPFGARVVADPNFGAIVDDGVASGFRPTRVLVDFTVSQSESAGVSVPVNSIGLPASVSNDAVNVLVRIPTNPDARVGQMEVLRNLAGCPLDISANGPTLPTSTIDVIRAFRSARSDDGATNQDPNNGFLLDAEAPWIVGSQPIAFLSTPVDDPAADDPMVLLVTFAFDVHACAQTPFKGNMLKIVGSAFPAVFAEVMQQAPAPQNGVVSDVRVRVLAVPPEADLDAIRADFASATAGEFQSIFKPGHGFETGCFVRITPEPKQPPTSRIDVSPQFQLRFSEPMDPASITPHDNFRLDRVSSAFPGPLPEDTVVGEIASSPDLREFDYRPLTPLDHVSSAGGSLGDEYFLNVVGGPAGAKDLAGNALTMSFPKDVRVLVDNALPSIRTGGFVHTFDAIDEDKSATNPSEPEPEFRGQFERDLARGVILPRPVTREQRAIDRTAPMYSIMTVMGGPTLTPLAPLGSRMMTVWRYADAGFQVLDESTANMDVEGLSFAPFGGRVSSDFFAQFEIGLAHSTQQPDEYPIPIILQGGGYSQYPDSGLLEEFAANRLNDPENELAIVHPRERGYLLTPSQVFTASTGTKLMPYPLNRGVPPDQFRYYTWRDTAILGTGGHDGFGADIRALALVGAICDAAHPTTYEPGQVRSLGLPLLMEFKCFPDQGALGLNALDTSFAMATEPLPMFRVFSTGSLDPTGAPIAKDPDAETEATGDFSTPWNPTPGRDNVVMLGQLDLVVRVSRAHSIWKATHLGAGVPSSPRYLDPILEPRADDLPSGTSVTVAFRGAAQLSGADVGNANAYDAYGDPVVTRIVADPSCWPSFDPPLVINSDIDVRFWNGDASWHADLKDLDGAHFIQARITFVSNAATLERPELSTLAVAYLH